MKLRFLHTSDVHLGSRCYAFADRATERRDDLKASFRQTVEYALEPRHTIDGVLVTGDLFDHHRPDEEMWGFTRGLISRLLAQDKVVAIVPGYHDSYAYKNSVWRTERLPGVELFLETTPGAPRVREIRGTRVHLYGVTYVPGQTPSPLPVFERVDGGGVHIALLHGLAAGHPEHVAGPHQLTLDLEALGTPGFDYVALGGAHAFTEYKVGATKAAYPGCPEGIGFGLGDTGDKGPLVVEFDDQGVHLERLVTNRKTVMRTTLDLRKERITDASGLKDALEAMAGRDLIVEVTLEGTAEFIADLDEIHQEVADRFFYLDIRDESRLVDSALVKKLEAENTIRGYFVRKLGERLETAREKAEKRPGDAHRAHDVIVLERALKLGVEQFVEEEAPADSIYSLIPNSDEMVDEDVVRSAVGVEHLEDRVKAMLESRRRPEDSAGETTTEVKS